MKKLGSVEELGDKCQLIIRVGKKQWIGFDLIPYIAEMTGRSKTDVKRLYRAGALDFFIDTQVKPK